MIQRLENRNCFDVLKSIDDGSIDLILTDPRIILPTSPLITPLELILRHF